MLCKKIRNSFRNIGDQIFSQIWLGDGFFENRGKFELKNTTEVEIS